MAERERAHRRQAELATPDARARRIRSRTAFQGARGAEAAGIARDQFRAFFDEPFWSQPKLRSGEQLGPFVSDYARLVERPGASNFLMVSTAPLRTPDPSGHGRPIDTTLRTRDGALEPRNVPSQLEIRTDARNGLRLGELGIRMAGTRRESRAHVHEDKAFFANVGPGADTDLIVAPAPGGAEIAFQLRSVESPEDPTLAFDLPGGAILRLVAAGTGAALPEGGAEVVRDGEVIAGVLPPSAVDADGQPVPVAYEVRGDELVVRVSHRGADVRYPILVDPYVREEFLGGNFTTDGNPLYRWGTRQDGAYHFELSSTGYGLGIKMFNSAYHPPYPIYSNAQWDFQAPPKTRIVRADFMSLYYKPYYSLAQAYLSADKAGWYIQGPRHDNYNSDWWDPNLGRTRTACADHPNCGIGGTEGNWATYRLGSRSSDGRWDEAWASMGQAVIHLWEGYRPFIGPSPLTVAPRQGWVDDQTHSFKFASTDEGLGVQKTMLRYPRRSGGHGTQTRSYFCGNRGILCPHSIPTTRADEPAAHSYRTSDLPDGTNTLGIAVFDVNGNPSTGPASDPALGITDEDGRHFDGYQWQVKVDAGKPQITRRTGTLWTDRLASDPDGAGLFRVSEHLDVDASDAGSGVASVELLVDGMLKSPSHRTTNTCSTSSCPATLSGSFDLAPTDLSAGRHTVTVQVKDHLADKPGFDSARHTQTESWTVWVPEVDEKAEENPPAYFDAASATDPVPIETTCEPDPAFTDPFYCQPDATQSSFVDIRAEPPADDPTATPLISGDSSSTFSATAEGDPSADCQDLGTPIAGSALTDRSGRWGLGDQNGFDGEKTFADSRAALLNVRRVRLIVPWDLIPKAQDLGAKDVNAYYCDSYRNTYQWIKYVRKELKKEPLISFNYSETETGKDPPASRDAFRAEYRAAVRAFVNQFPIVKLYTAFNEPNHPRVSPLRNDPYLAGKLYAELNKICERGKKCSVGGADVTDRSLTRSYMANLFKGMSNNQPAFWAVHTYLSLRHETSTYWKKFRDFDPVRELKNTWITEVGSPIYVESGRVGGGQDTQARRLDDFLASDAYRGASVKRFYYYLWHIKERPHPTANRAKYLPDWGLLRWDRQCHRKIYLRYLARTNPAASPSGTSLCPTDDP